MIRTLAAAILAAHGLIHLIGFVVPWGIAQVEGFPYRTSALAGAVALGETGARAVGVAWLVLAVGFVDRGRGHLASRGLGRAADRRARDRIDRRLQPWACPRRLSGSS